MPLASCRRIWFRASRSATRLHRGGSGAGTLTADAPAADKARAQSSPRRSLTIDERMAELRECLRWTIRPFVRSRSTSRSGRPRSHASSSGSATRASRHRPEPTSGQVPDLGRLTSSERNPQRPHHRARTARAKHRRDLHADRNGRGRCSSPATWLATRSTGHRVRAGPGRASTAVRVDMEVEVENDLIRALAHTVRDLGPR